VPEPSRQTLRHTFDEVPELYDEARPGHPPALFDDLVSLAGLQAGARVLEIGCGTGQATVPLADRGFTVTGIELGSRMAELARRNLARFANVEVLTADFETWEPAAEAAFDAVVAFRSFHWLSPEVRFQKPAELLGLGGSLAIVSTAHVMPEDGDPFFVEVQADYEAVVPDDPATQESVGGPARPDVVAQLSDDTIRQWLEDSGRFGPPAIRHYRSDLSYTADQYVALLHTYSDHRAFQPAQREEVLSLIRRRIESRPGHTVRRSELSLLYVAPRIA
jgi:SAM-dependent methyltransferase